MHQKTQTAFTVRAVHDLRRDQDQIPGRYRKGTVADKILPLTADQAVDFIGMMVVHSLQRLCPDAFTDKKITGICDAFVIIVLHMITSVSYCCHYTAKKAVSQ